MHPNIGTTYLRTVLIDLQRRFTVKTAMRSFGIIKDSVFVYHLLSLRQILKEVSAKAFISKFTVKAFHIAILPRTAFLCKFMTYTILLNELCKCKASALSPLVSSKDSWYSIDTETLLQDGDNSLSGYAELDIYGYDKSAKEVFNRHTLHKLAINEGVKYEIYSPDMIDMRSLCKWQMHRWHFLILAWSLSLQVKTFIDTIDLFMIDGSCLLIDSKMNSSVAIKRMAEGNLPYHTSQGIILFRLIGLIVQGVDGNIHKDSCSFCFNSKLNHLFSNHSPFVDGQKFF